MLPSPVPAYRTSGLLTPRHRAPIAREAWLSPSAVQVLPASLVRHTPPRLVPIKIVWPSVGWGAMAVTRPLISTPASPTSPLAVWPPGTANGPSGVQDGVLARAFDW